MVNIVNNVFLVDTKESLMFCIINKRNKDNASREDIYRGVICGNYANKDILPVRKQNPEVK